MISTNADFKLLCDSLGFYGTDNIREYFQDIEFNQTIAKRPVQYWLNGKLSSDVEIPSDVVEHFLHLEKQKVAYSQEDIFIKNTFLFKEKQIMWDYFPMLKGLPCSYLNQLMILVSTLHGHRQMQYFQYSHGLSPVKYNSVQEVDHDGC